MHITYCSLTLIWNVLYMSLFYMEGSPTGRHSYSSITVPLLCHVDEWWRSMSSQAVWLMY